MEVELIRALIISYFGIVRKHVADLVPKTIMHHLINRTKEVLQNRLVAALYRPEMIKELLQEEDNVEAERERCRVQLDIFRQALAIVNEVSE